MFSDFAVIVTYVNLFTLLMVGPIANSMAKIDRTLIEAAVDAGAPRWRVMTDVVIPLSKTGIALGSNSGVHPGHGRLFRRPANDQWRTSKRFDRFDAVDRDPGDAISPAAANAMVLVVFVAVMVAGGTDADRRCAEGTGEMIAGGPNVRPISDRRPWTFYALGGLFGAYMLFLYGPMLVIYVLSFQGENGGVTFPMVGHSTIWFQEILKHGQMANIPISFRRSISLAVLVSCITVVFAVAAGLGFRRRFPGSGIVFYIAVASLVMPGLLVGFGIGLGFQFLGLQTSVFTSALGAQLTWTLPFGLFAMFAVVNRFNRAWEEAAADLGATAWQRLRYVTLPILLPGILGVAMGALTTILR